MSKYVLMLCFICLLQASAANGQIRENRGSVLASSESTTEKKFAISLEEAIALGLRENRSIKSAYLERIAQRFDLRVAERRFVPLVSLSGTYLRSKDSSSGSMATKNIGPSVLTNLPTGGQLALAWDRTSTSGSSSSALTYGIIQPLLKGAGTDIASIPTRNARISEKINILSVTSAVSQIVTSIVFAYRDLQRLQDQEKIARASLNRSRDLLKTNMALIEAGRMARIDLIQAEADVASQEVAVEDASNQLNSASLSLANLLAMSMAVPIEASDDVDVKAEYVDAEQSFSQAIDKQPDYLAQLLSLELSKNNLRLAENNRLWDVSLVAGGTTSKTSSGSSGLPDQRNQGRYIGLQFAFPLNDLTPKQAVVRAQTQLQQANLQIEDLRQILEKRVKDAARDVQTRWRQLEIGARAVSLTKTKLQVEKEKLQVGRSSNFQVLSFENDLRSAESSLLNTKISYLNAITSLDLQEGSTLSRWHIDLAN